MPIKKRVKRVYLLKVMGSLEVRMGDTIWRENLICLHNCSTGYFLRTCPNERFIQESDIRITKEWVGLLRERECSECGEWGIKQGLVFQFKARRERERLLSSLLFFGFCFSFYRFHRIQRARFWRRAIFLLGSFLRSVLSVLLKAGLEESSMLDSWI